MRVFDASSMIYAWDNYPIRQFPPVWKWMAALVEQKHLVMPSLAFDEVAHKVPECGEWLNDHSLEHLAITNAIAQDAMRIKKLLGIVGDSYHPKGVGENDIFIIATAGLMGETLVSDEKRQTQPPDIPAKRRIPAVCAMTEVSVDCINFIEYLKDSNVIFG